MVSIDYEKFTLSNGLDVILHEDHTLPVTAVNIWYHVGSKDEEPGRTGFAHLFEHVMFEGSKNHRQSFFEPLQKVGANLNGSTTPDRTNYWENVPSNYLELALWLESDRMGFLLDALDQKAFDVQRDVVKNERRQSYENRPYGMAHLTLQPNVFPAPHPYSWPTIGSQQDLDAAALDDIKGFFRKFYAPSNASLAVAGDIDAAQVRALIEHYFGDLPPGPPINRIGRMDSELSGNVSLTIRDRVQLPRLYLVWPTVAAFHPQEASLDILSGILGDGKSSRLYRRLVYESQIARDVSVHQYGQEIAGEFFVQATVNTGHSLDDVEAIVNEELDRLRQVPPSEHELMRAKNRIESQNVRQLQRVGGFGGRADQLNYYNTYQGDPAGINTDIERYRCVTAEDVSRAANAALSGSRVRLSVLPVDALSASSTSVDRSAMPTAAAATASFSPPIPQRATLSNGMDVVLLEKPGLPIVAQGLFVRSGSITDSADSPGLASLTAAMLVEGTASRSSQQISDEMEFLGTQLTARASREYAILATETLTAHWESALGVLSDVVRSPTFPSNEFDRVRRQRLTDLGRVADSPVAIAGRSWQALLFGVGSRYGHPTSGTTPAVISFTRDNLAAHYAAHYSPETTTLLLVGDIRRSEAIERAEAAFGDWKSGAGSAVQGDEALPPTSKTTIYLADKPGAPQSVIRAGHLTIPRHHPDFLALGILNYIFGGQFSARLNMNLRQDKGYSYGYTSNLDWMLHASALSAGGSVQTDVTKEAVVETIKEFQDIRGGRPVTTEEFRDAVDGILRGLPSRFETHVQMLQQFIQIVAFSLPDRYFADYADRVAALTLEDVHRAAEQYLRHGELKIVVAGDGETVEPGLRELGLPVVRIDYEGNELRG